MRWTPSLEALANEYIRTAVGFDEDEATPPVSINQPRSQDSYEKECLHTLL